MKIRDINQREVWASQEEQKSCEKIIQQLIWDAEIGEAGTAFDTLMLLFEALDIQPEREALSEVNR